MEEYITLSDNLVRLPVLFTAIRQGEIGCFSPSVRGVCGVGETLDKAAEALRLELEDKLYRGQLGPLLVPHGDDNG